MLRKDIILRGKGDAGREELLVFRANGEVGTAVLNFVILLTETVSLVGIDGQSADCVENVLLGGSVTSPLKKSSIMR